MHRRFSRKLKPVLFPALDWWLGPLSLVLWIFVLTGMMHSIFFFKSAILIQTPLVKPTTKQPHLFEIRGHEVFYLDTERVHQQLQNLLGNLPPCSPLPQELSQRFSPYPVQRRQEYQSCQREQQLELKKFSVTTEFYQVRLLESSRLSFHYKLLTTPSPPPLLTPSPSPFERQLETFNPLTHYLGFIVRPDGFMTFRLARQIAYQQGFEVGWEPLVADAPLVLGTQGQAVGAP